MARLIEADAGQVRAIYAESTALWGGGLTPDGLFGLWGDLTRTRWARRHARFLVWADHQGRVLSGMKLYRPLVSMSGHRQRAGVFAAVFTPRRLRRRGHASQMLLHALAQLNDEGCTLSLLFSDIGTSFYSRLGFRELPAAEQWGAIRPSPALPAGWSIRPMNEDDHRDMRAAHAAFTSGRQLAVIRDPAHWEFLTVRAASFFDRLVRKDVEQCYRVVERDGRFVGYLISVEGRGDWNVRELGAHDGHPSTLAAVLRVGAAHAWGGGLRRFYGWLPEEVLQCLPEWRLAMRKRRRALPMLRFTGGEANPALFARSSVAFLPYQDQF